MTGQNSHGYPSLACKLMMGGGVGLRLAAIPSTMGAGGDGFCGLAAASDCINGYVEYSINAV
jgi:hypothetical protein